MLQTLHQRTTEAAKRYSVIKAFQVFENISKIQKIRKVQEIRFFYKVVELFNLIIIKNLAASSRITIENILLVSLATKSNAASMQISLEIYKF